MPKHLNQRTLGIAFQKARRRIRQACKAISDSAWERGRIFWITFRIAWECLAKTQAANKKMALWGLLSASWVLAVKCVVDEDCDANLVASQTFPGIKSARHVLRAELRLLCMLNWKLPHACLL